MEHYLTFGPYNSANYGILISGEGVMDSPKRDVETISIPGRNGVFLLDHNRFENITITYPAYSAERDFPTFMKKLEWFRNALSSLKGYQRLQDSFHEDEFRMAAFIDGFKVDPIKFNSAGSFEIKFNCKPQRYLLMGETEKTVTSGDTITNPTLFESNPLLCVEGFGEIYINDESLVVNSVPLGNVTLINGFEETSGTRWVKYFDTDQFNNGDTITVGAGAVYDNLIQRNSNIVVDALVPTTYTAQTSGASARVIRQTSKNVYMVLEYPSFTFTAGTDEEVYFRAELVLTYKKNGASNSVIQTHEVKFTYSAQNNRITMEMADKSTTDFRDSYRRKFGEISVYSTINSNDQSVYIDLDIGEAYIMSEGKPTSFNDAAYLPADLPTLKPGDNIITYDNTFTSFKVTPRWWRV